VLAVAFSGARACADLIARECHSLLLWQILSRPRDSADRRVCNPSHAPQHLAPAGYQPLHSLIITSTMLPALRCEYERANASAPQSQVIE